MAIVNITPKIEIAIVGDKYVGKTSLIKFWLSLNSESITTAAIYSKIFWADHDPVQINIQRLSENNLDQVPINKKYHAIIYMANKESIRLWMERVHPVCHQSTFHCIIEFCMDDNIGFLSPNKEMLICGQNIPYYLVTYELPTQLADILNTITLEAYRVAKKEILCIDLPSVIPSKSPVVCIEDEYVYIDGANKTDSCRIQ